MLTQSTLYSAAHEITGIQLGYAQKGLNLCQVALGGAKEFIEWQHYPKNDFVDDLHDYEFYYHSHSNEEMPSGEHGHFHLFKRNGQQFHHLLGIALNQQGLPVRLFTTNEWVTGEAIVDAHAVLHFISHFKMDVRGRYATLYRWIESMLKLYKSEITDLIQLRDRRLIELTTLFNSKEQALQSKEHHVLAECEINLIDDLSKYLSETNL